MAQTITMYGAEWCGDCRSAKRVLDDVGIEYRSIDLEAEPAAAHIARNISGMTRIPVIVFPDGSHLVEPTDAVLREKLAALV